MSADSAPAGGVLDPRVLRGSFGAFATGVTVVTVGGTSPHGMTANSFTPVSLNPPLILICVGRDAVMHRKLSIGFFGVSVLAAGQEAVARHFASLSRPMGAAQFDGIVCRRGSTTGVPLIGGAVAHFECELRDVHDGGDHSIFVGRLLSQERPAGQDDEALLFHRGRFHRTEPKRSEVTA